MIDPKKKRTIWETHESYLNTFSKEFWELQNNSTSYKIYLGKTKKKERKKTTESED